MMTLHTLRRMHNVSLSELARLTGISVRRLAEYEYEAQPLLPDEREAVAAFFQVHAHSIASGIGVASPAPSPRGVTQDQATILAGLAALAVLSLSLQLSPQVSIAPVLSLQAAPPAVAPAMVRSDSITLPPAPSPSPASALGVALAIERPTTPTATVPPDPPAPHLCPIVSDQGHIVVMADYTAATHTPTESNGSLDLVVDTDGDGLGEPTATRGASVIATHSGKAIVELDSWPRGNYVVIEGMDGWRSGYAHLQEVSVKAGEQIKAGQQIGLVGNTGQAGGPHLQVLVWHGDDNVDPTALLDCK